METEKHKIEEKCKQELSAIENEVRTGIKLIVSIHEIKVKCFGIQICKLFCVVSSCCMGLFIRGVATIGPTNIKIAKLPLTAASTFYRPGSQNVTPTFFREFGKLLEYMSTLAVPIYITGDINLLLIRSENPSTKQIFNFIASFSLL